MATIHTLAANCLYCGKVNCQQECGNVGGSDKAACCSFCKQPLFSNTQKRMGNGRRSTSSAARSSTPATYRAKLTGVQRHGSIHHTDIRSAATPLAQHLNQESTDDKQLAAAQSFRDRLLAADKSAAEQTHIHGNI
jgi:hypothetical protein